MRHATYAFEEIRANQGVRRREGALLNLLNASAKIQSMEERIRIEVLWVEDDL